MNMDNEPRMQERSPEGQMFAIESEIKNMMKDYEVAVRSGDNQRAQMIADAIDRMQKKKIELQGGIANKMIARSRPEADFYAGPNMAGGGEASFPDLTGDGQVTQADILKGRGVYAQGDEVKQDLFSEQNNRIQQLYSGATDAELGMLGQIQRTDIIPGTPEDYEKKIYLLEKEIANQFKEYHNALEGGFEEQAEAKQQALQKMMDQHNQLKYEYTNQFNSNKAKRMAEGGEAIGNDLASIAMSEEEAMVEVGNAEKEMAMIQQLVTVVQQLLAEGISEDDLVAFLKEQGLDDEDIDSLMQMVLQSQSTEAPDQIGQELQGMM